MRRLVLVIGMALVLSACGSPKIDTSTKESMQASVEKVKKALPPEKQKKFEDAVAVVAMDGIGNIFAAAANADDAERRVKERLNGKTADQVIAEADTIVAARKAKEKEEALKEIKELEAKKQRAEQARLQLKQFEVQRSRLYESRSGFLPEKVVELTVKNGTASPVSRVYLLATYSSPGRAVPWLKDDFNYKVPGGLEPGEAATWRLTPNMFSDWGKVEIRNDAVLTVEVERLDGSDEKPLFDATEFSEHDKTRLEELKKNFLP